MGEDSRELLRDLQTEHITEARSIYLPVPGSPRGNVREYMRIILRNRKKEDEFIDSPNNSFYYLRLQGGLAD